MTGYTVHTGTSVKFSDGWDKIFSKGAKKKSTGAKPAARQATAAKKSAKKTATAKKRGSR
jgi:hypothetical protein